MNLANSSFLSSDTIEEEILSSSEEDLPSNDWPITVQRGQASQADRTNNIDNISWVSNQQLNYSKEQEFTGTPGVTGEVTNADPLAIFQLFFTNELAEQIVTETNWYAEQCIAKKQVKNNSRDKRWKPLTVSELKTYVGIILYRGVNWKPTFSHYYTANVTFSTPMVSKVLLYNWLVLIERYIHFVDNNSLGERYRKTAKIASLHD